MKVRLLAIGRTTEPYLNEGIKIYTDRLKHYCDFSIDIIPGIKTTKNTEPQQQKSLEGKLMLKQIRDDERIVLLDEGGKQFSSKGFSSFIEKAQLNSCRKIVFVIGGAYGFSDEMYKKSHSKMSLSLMTFSHQMIRLIAVEQIYRAYTIIKGESYHHE